MGVSALWMGESFHPFLGYSSNDAMTDLPAAAKTKVAVTRKHLRRDQAAARKARSNALPGSDSIKERQVLYWHSL